MRRFPVMLFAAGFGTRMGELTKDRPKPLIEVAGRSLLDHALALTEDFSASRRVVNLHYLGEQIERHLEGREISLSWERELILETGGGLKAALPMLGHGSVMTLNTDAVWSGPNPLSLLADAWDEARMDALLLLAPTGQTLGHGGVGDFVLDAEARITRANGRRGPIYLGAQILRTEGLADISEPVFSLNRLWDSMISRGRAFGLIYPGRWCDVGKPEGIAMAEEMLAHSSHD